MPASTYLHYKRLEQVKEDEEIRNKIIKMNYKQIANMRNEIQPVPIGTANFYKDFGFMFQDFLNVLISTISAIQENDLTEDNNLLKNYNKLMLLYNAPIFNPTDKAQFRQQFKTAQQYINQIVLLCDNYVDEGLLGNIEIKNKQNFTNGILFTFAVSLIMQENLAIDLYKIISPMDIVVKTKQIIEAKNIPQEFLIGQNEIEFAESTEASTTTTSSSSSPSFRPPSGSSENQWGSYVVNWMREIDNASNPETLASDIETSSSSFNPLVTGRTQEMMSPLDIAMQNKQNLRFSSTPTSSSSSLGLRSVTQSIPEGLSKILERGHGELPSTNLTSGMPSMYIPPPPALPEQIPDEYLDEQPRSINIQLEPEPPRQPVNPPSSRRIFERTARNLQRNEEQEGRAPRPSIDWTSVARSPSLAEMSKLTVRPPPATASKAPPPARVPRISQMVLRQLEEEKSGEKKQAEGQGKRKRKLNLKNKNLDPEQINMIISKMNQPAQMQGRTKKAILNNKNRAEDLNDINYQAFMFNKK